MSKDLMGHGEAAKSAEVMTRELRKLILPFLKPVVSELGVLFGDLAHERIMEVLTRSTQKLAQSGLKPQPVQTKILVSMLQACVLEDDEEMVELWANLLTSAASAVSIPPVFVQTLSTLSPVEARLLDALRKQQAKLPKTGWMGMIVKDLRLSSQLVPQVFRRSILSLNRSELVRMFFDANFSFAPPVFLTEVRDDYFIGTAPFGDEFLAACTFRKS